MDATATSETISIVERLTDEGLIGLRATVALYPKGTHASTLARHCLKGVTVHGRVIRLEHVRLGGRLATTAAAVRRFIEAQQQPTTAAPAPDPAPTPKQRNNAAAKASREAARLFGGARSGK